MSNRRIISGKGGTYVITRRFLRNGKSTGAMRVRVTAYDTLIPLSTDTPKWTDYRDFTDMHEGDAAYAKQIARIQAHVSA